MLFRIPLKFYTAEASEAGLTTYLHCIHRMPKYNTIIKVLCQYNNQNFYP